MARRGPSPLIPSIMVGVIGLIIFGPTLMSLSEYVLPLVQPGDEGAPYPLLTVLPIVLLVLVHLISLYFPAYGRRSAARRPIGISGGGHDSHGFGLGSFLLLVLFFVLYNIW